MQRFNGQLVFSASDLIGFVACPRLTFLEHRLAVEGGRRPAGDPTAETELSVRKGHEHERAYLAQLRAEGRNVVEIPTRHGLDGTRQSVAETAEAIRAGAPVIYQAVFAHDQWLGHADFLVRVDDPESGTWSYEAVDTKLARHLKPYFVVQLCLYSELLAAAQGAEPEFFEVVLGNGERERLPVRDFDAYVRRLKRRFLRHVVDPREPYPDPVDHCAICTWAPDCDARRLADDHLCQVAGMRRDQIVKLGRQGIATMAGLARQMARPAQIRIGAETYERLHDQAALQ